MSDELKMPPNCERFKRDDDGTILFRSFIGLWYPITWMHKGFMDDCRNAAIAGWWRERVRLQKLYCATMTPCEFDQISECIIQMKIWEAWGR